MYRDTKLDKAVLKEIEARGIRHIYHFTTTLNLVNIFRAKRILNRQALDGVDDSLSQGINAEVLALMDEHRFDGYRSHVNVSIEHPNIYLMERYKKDYDDPFNDWCVIDLRAEVIALKGTLFSISNAASSYAHKQGIKEGDHGLIALYQNEIKTAKGIFTRDGLDKRFPTDVQAEALVPYGIPIGKIQRISFRSEDSKATATALFKGVSDNLEAYLSLFDVDEKLFGLRSRA